MSKVIVLKQEPKIEFILQDQGFQLNDEQTKSNSGFYTYRDLQSIQLQKGWYPKVAKVLRVFTWMINGVPLFPDAEMCKKANVIFHFESTKMGMWLTDDGMVEKAREVKLRLEASL